MRNGNLLEFFLVVQGVMLALAVIPFLVGLWHYLRARRIDLTGLRAMGTVSRVRTQGIREIETGPYERNGLEVIHSYTIKYVCHNGFARSLTFYDSGVRSYEDGEQLEVAYLRENADIARPAVSLYDSAYTGFVIAGILVAVPGLVVLWFKII